MYAIEGFSHGTLLTLMSKLGEKGISKFQNAQHFTSWLRFAPNNKISGVIILSSRTPKGSNRLKIALRQAANAIGNLKDTNLSNFFNRKGRSVPVSATVRKTATILWNMLFTKINNTIHQQFMNTLIKKEREKYLNFKNKSLI